MTSQTLDSCKNAYHLDYKLLPFEPVTSISITGFSWSPNSILVQTTC